MRRYDTTFILNPQIGDDRIDASVKEVTSIITKGKGEILRENRMGSRRLAFEIARQSHGYYVCLIHDSANAVLDELEHHFTLSDSCIRHLTIRYEGDANRQNMSEVMLGFESKKREAEDAASTERSSAARASAAPAAPATPVAPAATPAPAAAPEAKAPEATPEVATEVPTEVATEAEVKPPTEGETL